MNSIYSTAGYLRSFVTQDGTPTGNLGDYKVAMTMLSIAGSVIAAVSSARIFGTVLALAGATLLALSQRNITDQAVSKKEEEPIKSLSQLSEEVRVLQEEVQNGLNSMTNAENQLNASKKKVESQALESKAEAEKQLKLRSDMVTLLESLRNDVKEKELQIEKLKIEIASHIETQTKLQGSLDETQERVDELDRQLQEKEDNRTAFLKAKVEINTLTTKLVNKEGYWNACKDASDKELTELQTENDHLETQYKNIKAQFEKLKSDTENSSRIHQENLEKKESQYKTQIDEMMDQTLIITREKILSLSVEEFFKLKEEAEGVQGSGKDGDEPKPILNIIYVKDVISQRKEEKRKALEDERKRNEDLQRHFVEEQHRLAHESQMKLQEAEQLRIAQQKQLEEKKRNEDIGNIKTEVEDLSKKLTHLHNECFPWPCEGPDFDSVYWSIQNKIEALNLSNDERVVDLYDLINQVRDRYNQIYPVQHYHEEVIHHYIHN